MRGEGRDIWDTLRWSGTGPHRPPAGPRPSTRFPEGEVDETKGLEPPNRNFGVPLVSRPGSAHYSSGKRHPQNHVCRNEFFTMGAMPGENANVVASGYFKTIGRPFEGQWATNTCQKPRSLGKGQEWTSEIQPTCAPYRRTHAWSVPRYGDALQQDGRSLRERARLSANFKI